MTQKIAYTPPLKERFTELKPSSNGRFVGEWELTNTSLIDAVKIAVPPNRAVPIIFVPGIMGSNLCNLEGTPVWLLNSVASAPAGLAWDWARKKEGQRQKLLHPERTKVYTQGDVPEGENEKTRQDYIRRGWGEVSEASYHKFLLWLEGKIDGERNPLLWADFTHQSTDADSLQLKALTRRLAPGLIMNMVGLPNFSESGRRVDPIKSDELLKRSKAIFPVYAFGYNWLASNGAASKLLKKRIEQVIRENNSGAIKCTQVILVTHSMGGLVARACSQLPGMPEKIVGVVHGVMPATGAAVAYRRCKVGMRDEDVAAGLVIGSNGREVTAVFAQAPGALQLLPSKDYGAKWLEIMDLNGRAATALPLDDPYTEIYLEKEKWWGLVKEEWLDPAHGEPISWDVFARNVEYAREFHRSIEKRYHLNTFVFYGGGSEKGSFSKIKWNVRKGVAPSKSFSNVASNVNGIPSLKHAEIRTDGSNNLYIGGETVKTTTTRGDTFSTMETSFWEVRCASQDSNGDGTVPAISGKAPRASGSPSIIQQFELPGIQHEPAYRDYPVARQVTLYAITKLAAIADHK